MKSPVCHRVMTNAAGRRTKSGESTDREVEGGENTDRRITGPEIKVRIKVGGRGGEPIFKYSLA